MRCKHCNRALRLEGNQLYDGTKDWLNSVYSRFCEKRSLELDWRNKTHEVSKEDNIERIMKAVDAI